MRKRIFFILSFFCSISINYALGAVNTTTTLNATTSTDKQDKVIEQPIEVSNAWARLPANGNTAVYLVIKNNSDNDYTLTGASAIEAANDVQIHETVETANAFRMNPLNQIIIPAHNSVTMAPLGIHIMLLGVKYNMNVGTKFKLNLTFHKATETQNTIVVPCDVEVKDLNN